MNAYGELARDLWKAADARRFEAIERADEFFDDLGARVQRRVDELLPIFAGEAPAGEARRHHDLRVRRATKQAEEVAYQELIFSQTVVAEVEETEFVPSVFVSADLLASPFAAASTGPLSAASTGPFAAASSAPVDFEYDLHHVA